MLLCSAVLSPCKLKQFVVSSVPKCMLREGVRHSFLKASAASGPMASTSRHLSSSHSGGDEQKVDFTIIGCGIPGQSMGWYHSKQLIDGSVAGGRLAHIVTRVGTDAKRDPGKHFRAFKSCATAKHGVAFHKSLAAMQEALASDSGVRTERQPRRVAVISSCTGDCPRLLKEALSLKEGASAQGT